MTAPFHNVGSQSFRTAALSRRLIPPETVAVPSAQRHRRSAGTGWADADFPRDLLIRLIDAPEHALRAHTTDVIKAGPAVLVTRAELPMHGRMLTVAYKRALRRPWWKILSAMLRGNRTLRVWRLGRRLLARGVPTARPLAVVVPPFLRQDRPAYIVTEWVVGGENLTQFGRSLQQLPDAARGRRLREAATALARLIAQMHSAGFSHRDLKAGNLLLVPRNGHWQAVVIDLDGVTCWWRVPQPLRIRNLGRFAAAAESSATLSNCLRLRFLLAYLESSNMPRSAWKPMWRGIARRVEAVRARKCRRRR